MTVSDKFRIITSDSIETSNLFDDSLYKGIVSKTGDAKEEAKKDPKNYVTKVDFRLPSVDKNGNVLTTYEDKNGEKAEGHNNIPVSINLNLATYTDLYDQFKDVRKHNVSTLDAPARLHDPDNKGLNPDGKFCLDLDLAAIAKESNADRIAALKSKGITPSNRLTARDADKRIDITTKPKVVAKNGVGAISSENLMRPLTQIAATSFLMQNPKNFESASGESKNMRAAFSAEDIRNVGDIISGVYDNVMTDVVNAVNNNKLLSDIPVVDRFGAKTDNKISGTGFEPGEKGYGFKFKPVDIDDKNTVYTVEFTEDEQYAKKSLANIMKSMSNRLNKRIVQESSELASDSKGSSKLDRFGATYLLLSASRFEFAPVNIKDSAGRSTDIKAVSPRLFAQFSPYADKLTVLNRSMLDPTPGASAAILGEKNISQVEEMSKNVLNSVPHLDAKAFAVEHDKIIDKIQKELGRSFDHNTMSLTKAWIEDYKIDDQSDILPLDDKLVITSHDRRCMTADDAHDICYVANYNGKDHDPGSHSFADMTVDMLRDYCEANNMDFYQATEDETGDKPQYGFMEAGIVLFKDGTGKELSVNDAEDCLKRDEAVLCLRFPQYEFSDLSHDGSTPPPAASALESSEERESSLRERLVWKLQNNMQNGDKDKDDGKSGPEV